MAKLEELPWQIMRDGFGYPSIYGTNENGDQGDLIAHTFADHEHLIRSAPELLEALIALVERGTDSPQHLAAEIAIAKARGEA